jgi:hypothetical protein
MKVVESTRPAGGSDCGITIAEGGEEEHGHILYLLLHPIVKICSLQLFLKHTHLIGFVLPVWTTLLHQELVH